MSSLTALAALLAERPQYVYYAVGVGVLLVPAVPFCRVAALTLGVFLLGFTTPEIQVLALVLAGPLTLLMSRHSIHLVVAGVALSIGAVAAFRALGMMHPYSAYWWDYWLCWGRNCLLPFCMDWSRVRATLRHGWSGYKSTRTRYDWRATHAVLRWLTPAHLPATAPRRTMAP